MPIASRDRYAEAEPLYLKALKLAEETFGADHLEVSVVCNNLAVLYKYAGHFDRAEQRISGSKGFAPVCRPPILSCKCALCRLGRRLPGGRRI